MRKERAYRGFYTDGHDSGEIQYYSTYRNRSKQNMEDMQRAYKKEYGYSKFDYLKFSFGYMLDENDFWH